MTRPITRVKNFWRSVRQRHFVTSPIPRLRDFWHSQQARLPWDDMGSLTILLGLVILAVGFVLRELNLNQYGLNSDEAVYAGQAAGLAGFAKYSQLFGLFRAHPLLVQLLVSFVYRFTGVNGLAAREVCVVFGMGLIVVIGLIALTLWGRPAALIAMLFTALSPYPISISREMLLDGPEAFFAAVTLLLLCLYVRRRNPLYLWAAAFGAGLAFVSKETAILIVPGFLIFLLLAPNLLRRYRDLAVAGAIYVVTIAPYPLAELSAGKAGTGFDYFIWQILRPANHTLLFYPSLFGTMGWAITALAAVGTVVALRRRNATDILLVMLALVIGGLLEVWPTKGYEYLLPMLAPIFLLATTGALFCGTEATKLLARLRWSPLSLDWSRSQEGAARPWVTAVFSLVAVGTLLFTASPVLSADNSAAALVATDSGQPTPARVQSLAGSGGLLAGRPTGLWVKSHALPGSVFLTIGPTFANILQFYSLDRALALSVSPNPLHRNPSYVPVINADLLIRSGAIQYLVYDAYSASRSSHFADRLLALAAKFNGVLVYQYDQAGSTNFNRSALVLVYEVQP
ncbi:MAG: glycosyltransferase family 39 protein [Candidatus Dormiibacterota bacterium]